MTSAKDQALFAEGEKVLRLRRTEPIRSIIDPSPPAKPQRAHAVAPSHPAKPQVMPMPQQQLPRHSAVPNSLDPGYDVALARQRQRLQLEAQRLAQQQAAFAAGQKQAQTAQLDKGKVAEEDAKKRDKEKLQKDKDIEKAEQSTGEKRLAAAKMHNEKKAQQPPVSATQQMPAVPKAAPVPPPPAAPDVIRGAPAVQGPMGLGGPMGMMGMGGMMGGMGMMNPYMMSGMMGRGGMMPGMGMQMPPPPAPLPPAPAPRQPEPVIIRQPAEPSPAPRQQPDQQAQMQQMMMMMQMQAAQAEQQRREQEAAAERRRKQRRKRRDSSASAISDEDNGEDLEGQMHRSRRGASDASDAISRARSMAQDAMRDLQGPDNGISAQDEGPNPRFARFSDLASSPPRDNVRVMPLHTLQRDNHDNTFSEPTTPMRVNKVDLPEERFNGVPGQHYEPRAASSLDERPYTPHVAPHDPSSEPALPPDIDAMLQRLAEETIAKAMEAGQKADAADSSRAASHLPSRSPTPSPYSLSGAPMPRQHSLSAGNSINCQPGLAEAAMQEAQASNIMQHQMLEEQNMMQHQQALAAHDMAARQQQEMHMHQEAQHHMTIAQAQDAQNMAMALQQQPQMHHEQPMHNFPSYSGYSNGFDQMSLYPAGFEVQSQLPALDLALGDHFQQKLYLGDVQSRGPSRSNSSDQLESLATFGAFDGGRLMGGSVAMNRAAPASVARRSRSTSLDSLLSETTSESSPLRKKARSSSRNSSSGSSPLNYIDVDAEQGPENLMALDGREPEQGSSSALLNDENGTAHALELDPLSVKDHEAFAARHLPLVEGEVEDFQVFTWRVKNYRSQSKRLVSPEFECGGHKWNILLFPTGNSNGQANDMVSVYLNYGDPKHAKEGWHVCAQFALAISNPSDPTCFIQSQAHHRFNNDEQDWGFTRFVELKKLYLPADQRPKAVIDNDETDITAYVRVLKDPTGVLWHNFQNYDSKKETNYVGLKNQGATCYMNSLLQSLFLTNYYRKAVYQIPTDNDNLDSVALALQRVFYLLQTGDQAVGTNELTKSFGWKGFDSFLQHDVQEFNRVLQDKLEAKMKGTAAEGALNKLFLGKFKSYLRCINVDFESSRTEDFMDLQLNVVNMQGQNLKNLEESFRDWTEVEMMDGENKWNTDTPEHGLQDAKKGLTFLEFPPVLHLQLKRFQYDPERDANIKINDRFEFPFEIDLEPFMAPEADRSESWVYQLHGVLVHSGDVHGGHYFVLIKPSADGRWLRFDDDRVVHVTDKEVLEENFGGGEPAAGIDPRQPKQGVVKRFTNAYMLVYVRKTRTSEILAKLEEEDTPEHLRHRLDKEKKEAEQKKKDRDEMHLYLNVKVITDDSFRQHQGFDLATFDDRSLPESEVYTKRVLKQQTFQKFKEECLRDLQVPEGDVRLWVLVNRQNKTVRPDAPVPDNDSTLTMEVVRDRMGSRQHDLKLYLEYRKPGETKRVRSELILEEQALIDAQWTEQFPGEAPIMVFVKHFDVEEQSLAGIGHFYVHRHLKILDLAGMINEYMKYPVGTALKLYEEIKPGMIEAMKPKATFLQSEIQDGDVVCFQTELSEQSVDDKNKLKDPIAFYDYFVNRITVHFKSRTLDNPKAVDFDLMLSKKMTYDQMAMRVGDHLKHDFAKLRFWSSNGQSPKTVLRRTASHSVAEMVNPHFAQTQANLLFYELLDIPLVELETKKQVRVTWMGALNKDEGQHSFLQPKTSTINDVAEALSRTVKMSEGGSGRIRIFVNDGGRRMRVFHGGEVIQAVAETSDLYAEEIPMEEPQADENRDKVVGAFHFSRDVSKTHGVPFRFVIKAGERFEDTKKRLQLRTGVSDKELAKMKFSIVMSQYYKQPSFVTDDDVLYEHKWRDEDMLGIDHLDRTTKRTGERALVIR